MKTPTFAPKTPEHVSKAGKRISASLVASVLAFAYMCSKQAGRVSKKLKPKPTHHTKSPLEPPSQAEPFKSPMNKPKQLLTTISNKAITFIHKKKSDDGFAGDGDRNGVDDWGDGGVWQRSILMGDKCQPLDFSGVIYYDSNGQQISEIPLRSPRASPLPGYLERLGK